MRYFKGNLVVDGTGAYEVLERLGFKSEWRIASDKKREESMARFREVAAKRWTCPECGKEMSALSQNKHHASHQGGR